MSPCNPAASMDSCGNSGFSLSLDHIGHGVAECYGVAGCCGVTGNSVLGSVRIATRPLRSWRFLVAAADVALPAVKHRSFASAGWISLLFGKSIAHLWTFAGLVYLPPYFICNDIQPLNYLAHYLSVLTGLYFLFLLVFSVYNSCLESAF